MFIILSFFSNRFKTVSSASISLLNSPLVASPHSFAFFILAVAASEVAVGVGLLIAWHKKYHTLDLDSLQTMKG